MGRGLSTGGRVSVNVFSYSPSVALVHPGYSQSQRNAAVCCSHTLNVTHFSVLEVKGYVNKADGFLL